MMSSGLIDYRHGRCERLPCCAMIYGGLKGNVMNSPLPSEVEISALKADLKRLRQRKQSPINVPGDEK